MAIMENKHLFHNKIILDVGCGTGVLAMFAAQAGAKHVYAVDCSSIADQAREIIKINGFADRITVIKGKVCIRKQTNFIVDFNSVRFHFLQCFCLFLSLIRLKKLNFQ